MRVCSENSRHDDRGSEGAYPAQRTTSAAEELRRDAVRRDAVLLATQAGPATDVRPSLRSHGEPHRVLRVRVRRVVTDVATRGCRRLGLPAE